MSSNIDNAIITQANNFLFTLTSDTTTFDNNTIKEYTLRGFNISVNGTVVVVFWQYPDISWRDLKCYNPVLVNVFTAQQVYLYMTGGMDIRWLSPRVVYNKLINNESITELYGINDTIVSNIYNDVITALNTLGYDIRISYGVIYQYSGINPPIPSSSPDVINGGTF